ncbi:MAG TPA: type IV pilus biogenesis/stability protein PilW [Candidatus Competibacteraceae bacterium]|nr:MAG: type IV pilus biogenesis/stability protein PilW [Candidatus Competibacteraceae bacterium]HNW79223.1 type IV pilus biogenesis/stability protein PilW [Candidatus Competibacteraceae bacterium]HQC71616.1 type IV pilus biogenesis/stability protein PilW [Candidatus Competibacteraceae bacterium]
MRLAVSPLLLATVLLAGCASSADKDFKRNVAEANFKLGIGYMQSGHLEVAAEKLLKALQYDDDYPEAHNALGVLYEEMREYSPATDHYQRAISLKPDYTLAKLNYARLLCTGEPVRTAEGEAEFRRIAADPANAGATAADAYAGLASCALKRDDLEQAEAALRQSLDSDPSNASALYDLAQLNQRRGNTLQGRAFLQRFHSRSRATAQSLWLGILIESSPQGDAQLRQQYANTLATQYPNSDEARRLKQPQ